MKIAIDIRTAGGEKTGKGWYTFHLVHELLKLDTENEYILYSKDGIPGFQQFKNAELRLIDARGIFWHRKVAKDIVNEDVDVFFAPSSYIIPALLPKSIKTILTVHDLVAFFFPNTHNKKATIIEKLFLKRALKRATKVVTVSENTKNDLINKFKYEERKIDVIYCSASDDFKPCEKGSLSSFIKETQLPAQFFLAVGTLEPRKNYINLIQAFSQIHEQFPHLNLIIVGGKGWDYEKIFQLIRDNYLQKKVHMLGYLSNTSLLNLYNLAKALVFPSYYEGFGIPPLEAMKCGCPVIASFSSSIPEVVGEAALLINPENHLEIAGAMAKIMKDENLAESLSNKGLIQARKFSWEESAKKLKEIIEELGIPSL